MVEAYSNAKRMLLNVRIKAPLIIVPVDSKSLQAISIDLGHLCITNRCSNIPNSAVVNERMLFLKLIDKKFVFENYSNASIFFTSIMCNYALTE